MAITEGNEDLLLMMHSAAARAAIVGGHLYVALTDSGVIGTASWFRPGSGFLDSEEQMDQGMKEFGARLASLKLDVFQWYTKLLASYQNFCKKAFGSADDPTGVNFKRDNWKIHSFAVLPSYQGRGIGRLLLEVGERQVM
ncbi:hypothetical protein AB1N83_012030 [Pleurotus pulmonarius]|nr:hypothetical protein EYR38_001200 [Pleurotus pulmonarius]